MPPIRSGNLCWASHTAGKGSAYGRGKEERNGKMTLPSRIVSLFFHPNVRVEHQQTAESLLWKWVWLVGVNVNKCSSLQGCGVMNFFR